MRRLGVAAFVVGAATLGHSSVQAAEPCAVPAISYGVIGFSESISENIEGSRALLDARDQFRDVVDGMLAANDESIFANSGVRFYTLTGGTIRLEDKEHRLHVFSGSGIVKLPFDGTAVGTVIAPDAMFDFDIDGGRLDGAVVAKEIVLSVDGTVEVTGRVDLPPLLCAAPVAAVDLHDSDKSEIMVSNPASVPQETMLEMPVTGVSMFPAVTMIVLGATSGALMLLAARKDNNNDDRSASALPVDVGRPVVSHRVAASRRPHAGRDVNHPIRWD